jgi:hypothetical protein
MPKTIIKILIVTEEEGSFDPTHRFGLSELVNTLKSAVYDFVEFNVTTAHRSWKSENSYASLADIEHFRFDENFSIYQYHQVWLFGFSNYYNVDVDPFILSNPPGQVFPLTDEEVVNICKFMDAGGGVFATGDHENLGINLCGRIPRVRSMRRWEFDYTKVAASYDDYDEAGTDAPPVFGRYAHDTLVPGHNSLYDFDDQSDDVPQEIQPKLYYSGSYFLLKIIPHPLLCSPKGIIDVLPDHMHEGQCQEPEDLSAQIVLPNYNKPEYPSLNGYQESPEVIARGTVEGGHAVPLPYGSNINNLPNYKNAQQPTEDDSFGNICVYDGHNVNVGRIVVDSTFHHFVNINLIGIKDASYAPSDDSKKIGFNYSVQGMEYYEKIKAYYCNIALYLMTADIVSTSFHKLIWKARFDSQLKMLTPAKDKLSIRNYSHWMFYGKSVYETLQRQLNSCMVFKLTGQEIDPFALLFPIYFIKIHTPDPPPDYLIGIDRGEFFFITLANIMINLKEQTVRLMENDYPQIEKSMHNIILSARNNSLEILQNFYLEKHERTMRYMEYVQNAYLVNKDYQEQ